MGNGMNKVLPGLYVGNYRDSKDPLQLERYRITHILAVHDAARRLHSDKHYLCVMASDSPEQNLTQYFSLCNDFIHAARLRDGNVLVHCLAGMSRSVTVAVAYIMSVTGLPWREALKVVRAGRAVANPNLGFQRQLQDFESYKLVEERRRLKERYPSLALAESDQRECQLMLDSYKTMLSERSICEGKCALGRQCPTGVCRNSSSKRERASPGLWLGGLGGARGDAAGHTLARSPSILSTASMSSYRPRSSPAGLYSYTGRTSLPSRSVSGMNMTLGAESESGSAVVVGGSEWTRVARPLPPPRPQPPRRLAHSACHTGRTCNVVLSTHSRAITVFPPINNYSTPGIALHQGSGHGSSPSPTSFL